MSGLCGVSLYFKYAPAMGELAGVSFSCARLRREDISVTKGEWNSDEIVW